MHGDLENRSRSLSVNGMIITNSNHDTYINLPARNNTIGEEE